jgi:glycosyltransferase involved in cell wall biosynthesis
MPRVSVIIAARDASAYLPETLDSLFAQTFEDWEAVVVDDASTDRTAAIARARGDRVRVISNERPLGPGPARNIGFELAAGELVATLDADDLWTPRYLEEQVALYDRARSEGRRVGVVCCDARLLGSDGFEPDTFADRSGRPRGTITLTDLVRVNMVFTSVIAPRAAILRVGGYDTSLFIAEDYDLWVRMAEEEYELVWNPEPLAVYRLRPDSLLGSDGYKTGSTVRVLERALQRGRLDRRQRRIARRQRRRQLLLARRAEVAAERNRSGGGLAKRIAILPMTLLVALERPHRWLSWIRQGGTRRAGPGGGLR